VVLYAADKNGNRVKLESALDFENVFFRL